MSTRYEGDWSNRTIYSGKLQEQGCHWRSRCTRRDRKKFTLWEQTKDMVCLPLHGLLVVRLVDRPIRGRAMAILQDVFEGVCLCVSTLWDLQEMRFANVFDGVSSIATTMIMAALSCFIAIRRR
ncbi:unnamed protein product [Dovyalis caffra]|uniref:Uncharacterized protein n=1 Tax=Dovyalis caffra TaxID=77055 RepID=A0AAV1R7Z9_9ROSI|nr:unnamed protein product [Dovyalis caffra]